MSELLRINSQPEASEIFIKSQTWNIVKQMGNDNIGDRVTKGKSFVLGEFFEDFLSRGPDRVIVFHDKKGRFYCRQKGDRYLITCTVSEKGDRFADDIPCRDKRYLVLSTMFKEFSSPVIVGVVGGK